MKVTYTPGPWTVSGGIQLVGDPYSREGQHALYVANVRVADFAGSVCSVQSADHCEGGINRDTAQANARLIAAAPELLAACEKAMTECCDLIETEAGNALKAAIAKATGETA